MSDHLASQLNRLYFDYYSGRLEFNDYRHRRAILLNSLKLADAGGPEGLETQPRTADMQTQVVRESSPDSPRPQKEKRFFNWISVLAVCGVVIIAVVFIVLRQIEPGETDLLIATPESAPLDSLVPGPDVAQTEIMQAPGLGQALVQEFVEQQDWREMSLLEFQESWERIPVPDRIVARGAVWFQPLEEILQGRISETKAIAIDPENDEQLDQLYKFALHLSLVELVPPDWAPRPEETDQGSQRVATPSDEKPVTDTVAAGSEDAVEPVEIAVVANNADETVTISAAADDVVTTAEIAAAADDDKVKTILATVAGVTGISKLAVEPIYQNACKAEQLKTRRRNCFDILEPGKNGPLMRVLPGGEFIMGNDSYPDEQPARTVTMTQPFAISVYEITRAEFGLYCQQTGSQCPGNPWPGDDMPVVEVDWHQASAYCDWLTEKTGQTYRLPTEEEWEYAARGGTSTKYPYGDKLLPAQARFSSIIKYKNPLPTSDKTTQRNDFGLWHVVGNVREWVAADWSTQSAVSQGEKLKVVRGGSYANSGKKLRSSARQPMPANEKNKRTGFRIIREL